MHLLKQLIIYLTIRFFDIFFIPQAVKANIKLNTKKLYQADGYAVKELLKITTLLYEAQSRSTEKAILMGDNLDGGKNFDISDRINELKSTRQLASQLTINGATLFDLLGREVELREIRNTKISRQFDTSEIEVAMKELLESVKLEINETKKQMENIKDTEQNLDSKIERRRTELDRNQKRLQTLRKVRPAFMEEFEKLEVELKTLYDDYLQKFRYLAYLEHLHEDANKAEQERFERRRVMIFNRVSSHNENLRIAGKWRNHQNQCYSVILDTDLNIYSINGSKEACCPGF